MVYRLSPIAGRIYWAFRDEIWRDYHRGIKVIEQWEVKYHKRYEIYLTEDLEGADLAAILWLLLRWGKLREKIDEVRWMRLDNLARARISRGVNFLLWYLAKVYNVEKRYIALAASVSAHDIRRRYKAMKKTINRVEESAKILAPKLKMKIPEIIFAGAVIGRLMKGSRI